MRAAMSPTALAGRVVVGRAVLGLGLAGCQTAPEPHPAAVTVHGDAIDLTLTRVATGCEADGAVIVVGGDTVTSGDWRLGPGPSGRELSDHGALVARVVDEPGRRSYLDATGVPLGRVSFADGRGTIAGAARDVVGGVTRDAGALRWTDAGGRTLGRVTGTDDVDLALALVAPSTLPPAARALVACARLAATTSSPAK
jgi:hypothetical protein